MKCHSVLQVPETISFRVPQHSTDVTSLHSDKLVHVIKYDTELWKTVPMKW
jgi:hypothetical protein